VPYRIRYRRRGRWWWLRADLTGTAREDRGHVFRAAPPGCLVAAVSLALDRPCEGVTASGRVVARARVSVERL
jgi:hypothetical protein